jgi:hypothetical protein
MLNIGIYRAWFNNCFDERLMLEVVKCRKLFQEVRGKIGIDILFLFRIISFKISSRIVVSNVDPSQSQSHVTTDGQSVCLSWCRAPSGAHDQIFVD